MLRRVEDIVQREVAGEVFLVPIRGRLADLQELFVLSETGRCVWEGLDGRRTPDDLAAMLVRDFDVDTSQAVRDTEAFLEQLAEAGLVEEATAAAGV